MFHISCMWATYSQVPFLRGKKKNYSVKLCFRALVRLCKKPSSLMMILGAV